MQLGIDLSTVPDATDEQDERVTVLVMRRHAGGTDLPPDAAASLVQLVALIEELGYDPAQSYLGTTGVERDLGGVAPILDVLGSVTSV